MFDQPKLKVERANHHIKELDDTLADFCKTNFYSLGINVDPKSGTNILVFQQTKDIPRDIPLLIGDAIHNLRAALDILTCDIMREAGRQPTAYTKFPFRKTRDELIAAFNGGELKTANAGIIDVIVDTIQPYPSGNGAPLFRLHELDVLDKHMLIIPIISVVKLTGVSGTAGTNAFEGISLSVSGGGVLRAIGASAPLKIRSYGQPSFNVFFDDGNPFEGQSVIPTLHQLSQLVSGVIDAIEQLYSSEQSD